ncbi:MAG TPA: recombinase RecT [Tepidisphaeraceae bacterium]|jgi:phage recombination protein Bet
MADAIAIIDEPSWSAERRAFIRKHFCADAPDHIAEPFIALCERRGLAPEEKQIYLVKRGKDWITQTGIDGYRALADRTGAYAGSDKPRFHYDPDNLTTPDLAEVTVWKIVQGQRCAFTGEASWEEYCPEAGQDFMWRKMPRTMLAKCSEALALRKAFPAQLSGIYVQEELDQAEPRARSTITVIAEGASVGEDAPDPKAPPSGHEPAWIEANKYLHFIGGTRGLDDPDDAEALHRAVHNIAYFHEPPTEASRGMTRAQLAQLGMAGISLSDFSPEQLSNLAQKIEAADPGQLLFWSTDWFAEINDATRQMLTDIGAGFAEFGVTKDTHPAFAEAWAQRNEELKRQEAGRYAA